MVGKSKRDAIKIIGIPESPATHIVVDNCKIQSKGLLNFSDVHDMQISNCHFESESTEVRLCDVRDLRLSNVKFSAVESPWRIKALGPELSNIKFQNCSPELSEFQISTGDNADSSEIKESL